MPELPEVETVCRGLNQKTLGQPIANGEILLARTIAFPSPTEFLAGLIGCELVEWQRRGKYLLGQLQRQGQPAGSWGVHLRMTGQMLWVPPDQTLEKHARVRLFFATQALPQELRYVDQRTFGQMWWVPADRNPNDIIHGLANLGPEPFWAEFSEDYLVNGLRDRHRPIKNALLDQSLVAGVGNIYADESLFLSRIHPKTSCSTLTRSQIASLRNHVIQVLEQSIAAQGTTLRDYRTVEGVNGNYGGQAWVYGRNGQPCLVCGTPIERMKLAGRSAHFCPSCQSEP